MKIKLSRVLKIISTILIAVGIAYLFLFVLEQNRSVTDILDKPSYYAIQNYKMLFLSGIAAVACAVLGSFFSWSVSSRSLMGARRRFGLNFGYSGSTGSSLMVMQSPISLFVIIGITILSGKYFYWI